MPARTRIAASIVALVAAGATAYGVTRATGDRVDNAVACHDEPTLRSSVTGILDANGASGDEACGDGVDRQPAAAGVGTSR